MAEMNKVDLALKVALSLIILLHCCEGTSTTLSPLGMVSVCPGGQVLLTCETNNSVFHWIVSSPHLDRRRERIVTSQGILFSSEFRIGFTEFNVSLISRSPLISQLLINNVTNGSRVYCSEDGNENNSPMSVINEDDALRNADHSLNVTLINHILRIENVTVTLQWPREAGVVYHVSLSPEIPHTEFTTLSSDHIFVINLTISYNIQYNVSIVSSLCGVTTTKVLKYAAADCGVPLVNSNVILDYSSTLDGSVLTLTCENDTSRSTDEEIVSVTCHSSGNWIPDPAQFTCSLSTAETSLLTTVQTTPVMQTGSANLIAVISSTMTIMCAVSSIVFLSIGYACGWFSQKHRQSCSRKAASDSSVEENTGPNEGSQLPPTPGPLYEELQQRSTPEHQDLVELKENVAYGPIVK